MSPPPKSASSAPWVALFRTWPTLYYYSSQPPCWVHQFHSAGDSLYLFYALFFGCRGLWISALAVGLQRSAWGTLLGL